MKTLIKIVPAVLLFTVAVLAQEDIVKSSATISTQGKAEIFVEPDVASMTVAISRVNKDIDIARKSVDEAVEKIWDVMRVNQIDSGSVGISQVRFGRKFEYISDKENKVFNEDGDEIGVRTFVGYEVSTVIGVRLTDLSKFEGVYVGLLGSGANNISAVSFQTSKLREYKDRARTMAMKAAKEKADALAAAVGQTVGKAIKIDEEVERSYRNLASNNQLSFETVNSPGSFKADKISVSATVEAVFILK